MKGEDPACAVGVFSPIPDYRYSDLNLLATARLPDGAVRAGISPIAIGRSIGAAAAALWHTSAVPPPGGLRLLCMMASLQLCLRLHGLFCSSRHGAF